MQGPHLPHWQDTQWEKNLTTEQLLFNQEKKSHKGFRSCKKYEGKEPKQYTFNSLHMTPNKWHPETPMTEWGSNTLKVQAIHNGLTSFLHIKNDSNKLPTLGKLKKIVFEWFSVFHDLKETFHLNNNSSVGNVAKSRHT